MDDIKTFTSNTLNIDFSSPFSDSLDGVSGFPRSPKLGTEGMDLTGIFAMKSPVSILALDMDVNFGIQNEGYTFDGLF